jgi:hypothetical protein
MLVSISLEPIPIEIDQLKANESTSSKQQTGMAPFSTHLVANVNMVELEYSMTRKGRINFFAMNEQQLIQRRQTRNKLETNLCSYF